MNRRILNYVLGIFFLIPNLFLNAESSLQKPDTPPADSLTEQRIYVPYKNLQEALDKQDKGVFIPHSEFLKLWEEATRKPETKDIPPPPIDAAILYSKYKGTVEGDEVKFQGELKISALKDKWAKVSLPMSQVAVTLATLNDQTPLLSTVPGGLELILPEKGDYLLKLEFSARVENLPGKKQISFNLPPSPLLKLEVSLPGTDLDVGMEPLLSKNVTSANGRTEVSSFLAPEGKVELRWISKTIESSAKSLIFANLFTEVEIREAVYSLKTKATLNILQAKTDTLHFKIPKDLHLVRVEGPGVREWNLAEEGTLTLSFFEKTEGTCEINLWTEKYRQGDVLWEFPALEILDTAREEGVVAIRADSSLRIKTEKLNALSRLDPQELNETSFRNDWISVFKYYRHPFGLTLSITPVEPRLTNTYNNLLLILDTTAELHSMVDLDIQEAGIFSWEGVVPEGYKVLEAEGENVDNFSVASQKDKSILKVLFKNKVIGKTTLHILMEKERGEEDALSVPLFSCVKAEREEGVLAVSIRKNLKLSTDNLKGLRPLSLDELNGNQFSNPDPKNEMAAAYRFSKTDYSGLFQIEKRAAKVSVQVFRTLSLEENSLKTVNQFRYSILYAPVKQFRIEMPAEIAKEAVFSGEGIKEKKLALDEAHKTGIWTLELHAPIMDLFEFKITTDQKHPEIQSSSKTLFQIPPVKVLDVFNEAGWISVEKSPSLELEDQVENLEQIDVRELPAGLRQDKSVLAYKYLTHPYKISVSASRHDYEKVLTAIVTEAHFDMVVSEEGIVKTEALYIVKNTGRQSLEILMPKGIEKVYAVFVQGKKAGISKGNNPESKILMLPRDIEPDREFSVRIIYESTARKLFGSLGTLFLKDAEILDLPILKISWRLFLPKPYTYLYMDGTIHPEREYSGILENINSLVRSERYSEKNKIQVSDQKILLQADEAASASMDVDLVREGKLYRFSKLDGGANLSVFYLKHTAFWPLLIGIFAFSFFISLRFLKKSSSLLKPLALLVIALFMAKLFIPQGFKYFLWIMMLGTLCAGGLLKWQKNNPTSK